MKSNHLGTATLILGALGASFAACSTATDSSPNTNTTAGSGSSVAGASNVAGSTSAAGSTDVAGGSSVAGASNVAGSTGVAGSIGAAGSSGATGTAGAGGGPAKSCGTLTANPADAKCCIAAGTATDLAVDDLEDKDNVILSLGQRQGYWYTYGTDAGQAPKPMTPFLPTAGGHACSLTPAPPACAGMTGSALYSSHTSGSLLPATDTVPTYAGMGLDFNNHFAKSCAYGASAYKGISFWAKGTVPFHAAIAIPATTPSTSDGGTCVAGVKPCADHYFMLITPVPDGTTWTQFTITFADTTTFAQAGWGASATFDPAHILNLQFQVNGETTATAATPYDFAVDDLAFVP